MAFSSLAFLFGFLPLALLCYFLIPARFRTGRNTILLLFSLAFYCWGGMRLLPVLLVSCAVNWAGALLGSVNMDDYESLQYFQRVLINSGVIDALRQAGVQEGDTVCVYDLEFDFVE